MNLLFRFACGVILTTTSGVLVIGDIWRLNNPASCDASSLCTTPGYRVPAQVSVQLYLAVIMLAFGLVLICKARGGRLGIYNWLVAALIPSSLALLAYYLLMATNTTGIVQFDESKRGDLGFDIFYSAFMLILGLTLLMLHRHSTRERSHD